MFQFHIGSTKNRVDGDDTEGEREVIATLDVVCAKGKAVVAEITTDTPADDMETV